IRRHYTCESADPLYWGNSNRVLQSYETGRRVARLKGRLIRPHDEERDDGVLAIQIQQTRTGIGAAPCALADGTFAHLQISTPDVHYRKARLSFRVDAAGHHVVTDVWMHRSLPPRCRVKAAQLTWRRRGPRLRWQLCLTIDPADCHVYAPLRQAT